MMAKYKTEKRKANVGERILITNAFAQGNRYANGDINTVETAHGDGVIVKEHPRAILSSEYEVIVADKPSKSEHISLLESQVAELQAKVEALEKPKETTVHNVTVNLGENSAITAKQIAEGMRKFASDARRDTLPKSTPNEQRKAVIERAKAFIEESKVDLSFSRGKGYVLGEIGRICDVQFIVNNDKRTVVSLFRWRHDGNVYAKAIAKCAPDDVFNADIGKAIALGRALGLDVSEFENAVKPTEYVNGHIVTFPETDSWHRRVQYRIDDVSSADNNMTITSDEIAIKGKTGVGRTASSDLTRGYLPIIGDTEAQY